MKSLIIILLLIPALFLIFAGGYFMNNGVDFLTPYVPALILSAFNLPFLFFLTLISISIVIAFVWGVNNA